MLTTVSPASATATSAPGSSPPGGGGTSPGSRGGSHKRICSSGASPDEDTNDNSSLSSNSPAPVRYNPNTFVSYNSLILRLRRIGEEKKKVSGKTLARFTRPFKILYVFPFLRYL